MDLASLSRLQTEAVNPRTARIDQVSTLEMCRLINEDDHHVASSVTPFLPQISAAIDALTPRVRNGGRVIYVGAGTSGRLGILDASEIPPTFAAPPSQFIGLIAGGDAAIRRAQEGAEDSIAAGEADMQALQLRPELDSVIGIAASGRTPYVLGCLAFAKRKIGCVTIGVVCASPSAMGQSGTVDFLIAPLPGPEVVTGSTRLKAGTATKLVLNMLSTGTMIRTGKTYGNMMVDLVASNLKLEQRSRNILRRLSAQCHSMADEDLDALLARCHKSVKLALLVAETGRSVAECEAILDSAGGVLAQVLKTTPMEAIPASTQSREYVLCIDGGGTKCAALIADRTGNVVGRGLAGPCNLTDGNNMTEVIATLVAATSDALKSISPEYGLRSCFRSVWLGLAGLDRINFRESLLPKLCELFDLGENEVRLTNDVDLLAAAARRQPECPSAIVVIAGTGSVAMRYTWDKESTAYSRVARSGGWGHILGDEGGGYAIGLQAIKHTLTVVEEMQLGLRTEPLGDFEQAILLRLGCSLSGDGQVDLLSEILVQQQKQSVKGRIATVAEIVLNMGAQDDAAAAIVDGQIESLVNRTLGRLVHPRSVGYLPGEATGLIVAGSVLNHQRYKQLFLEKLQSQGVHFAYVESVSDAGELGARFLAKVE
ncbi:putative glucokinase regulator family protein [Aspergillus clavatus NRRL 1]|uniref:N-acetyl-D-glucosamine kinase n=1 Tax=Aspergillus clavatus (strain ATCC 1007 / CBS 513.65 / DSM 816 / NCTC 3887 / NRRL 1 / QM 1276 / 107) TaxID=344612 RepID=A1CN75_ASPCL|nr:glucokinase regulator family protein, putative [Aspergillus clavatus NRRL 1]EAW07096.1 glucokinase regulator family protein, putative [Aspergillus clavatus NRRL 1]